MLKDFSKMKFDVVIQAGQSNAEGTGFGPAPEPFQPDDRVWYMNRNFTVTAAAETVLENETRGDFSLSFAREYLKNGLLEEGRDLLILRSAVGGTGFLDRHWGPEDDHFLTMMEMIETALTLNNENRLIALLWHQGETDACYNATSTVQHFFCLRFALCFLLNEMLTELLSNRFSNQISRKYFLHRIGQPVFAVCLKVRIDVRGGGIAAVSRPFLRRFHVCARFQKKGNVRMA